MKVKRYLLMRRPSLPPVVKSSSAAFVIQNQRDLPDHHNTEPAQTPTMETTASDGQGAVQGPQHELIVQENFELPRSVGPVRILATVISATAVGKGTMAVGRVIQLAQLWARLRGD